jgi:hypothetical protein
MLPLYAIVLGTAILCRQSFFLCCYFFFFLLYQQSPNAWSCPPFFSFPSFFQYEFFSFSCFQLQFCACFTSLHPSSTAPFLFCCRFIYFLLSLFLVCFFLSKTFSSFFTKAGKNEEKVSIAESMDG